MPTTLLVLAALLALVLALVYGRKQDTVVRVKKREMGVFTREQVAQHATRDDLWVIVKSEGTLKVYDLTSYVDEHPGGDAILTNAGGDSTAAFFGPQHPPRVFDLLDDFCIGTIAQ